MWQNQVNCSSSSYRESLKALEADIQHANTMAASLPRDYNGDCVQMRLAYSPLAPLFIYLIEWMDYSCTDSLPTCLGLLHILIYKVYVDGIPSTSSKERKASLREFYSVIYPSLTQLQDEFVELEDRDKRNRPKNIKNNKHVLDSDCERDDECGICMENRTKMVLPNCGHTMCICCFHDWNSRSESCPFCRGNLKRVSSTDLWVLTSNSDMIDPEALAKENLRRFHRYVDHLPAFVTPDSHVLLFNYML